jgi:hypothetical protein
MRNWWLGLALGLISLSPAIADSPGGPDTTRVEVPVLALLTPSYGYEEKNNIEVILWGKLPNQCYTLSQSDVARADGSSTLWLRQYAIHDTSGVCADESTMPDHMKVPVQYTVDVSVGHLAAGTYTFQYADSAAKVQSRTMQVAPNVTPTVDTLPYAAVTAAIAPDVLNGAKHLKVRVTGVLNSTCTKLDPNIKILRENDVFVLMPTISVIPGATCGEIMDPFGQDVDLGTTFPGPHLIHVRSMNGKSVNKVVLISR